MEEDGGDDEMPKANDRKRRVKDRIIEGIAKAVKHIQSYQMIQSSEEQNAVLKNSDWQFHKLVENLDHAFLYGLRHFSRGYWVVVQEFTHKSTIEDIIKMSNIVTDLGRSRAWLYLALSDRLLESYIHCFIKNAEMLRKHYVKEALVLDGQRLELLLTLSSGLELITFDLEVNVQYLDLCSCMKVRTESQEEEDADDNISLCSMISSQSQNSSVDENQSRVKMSPLSFLNNLMKPFSFKLTPDSKPSSLTLDETKEEKKMRIETFVNTEAVPTVLSKDDSTVDGSVNCEVEVIHIRPKRFRVKRGDRTQKSPSVPESDNSSLVSADSSACLLLSPISSESSGYQTVPEDSGCTQCVDGSPRHTTGSNLNNSDEIVIKKNDIQGVQSSEKLPDEKKHVAKDELSQNEKLLSILEGTFDAPSVGRVCQDDVSERKIFAESSAEQNNLPLAESVNEADSESTSSPSRVPEQSFVDNRDDEKPAVEAVEHTSDFIIVASGEEPSIYDSSSCTTPNTKHSEVSSSSVNSCDDAFSETEHLSSAAELSEAKNRPSNLSTSPQLPSDIDTSLETNLAESPAQADRFLSMSHSSEIEVDNNLKVVLMLEVFLHEEENLYKMFRTCQGHSEGKIVVTYVVITSHYLYFLIPSSQPNKFTREVAITYKELDYVSISLNYQVLHIVCRARHNQFWITTGDEVLSRIIASYLKYAVHMSLDDCARRGSSSSPSLMILEDATAQRISIAKLVSEEMAVKREDVLLLNYSLVHWEDSEAIKGGDLRLNRSHEGVLFFKVYTAAYLFTATTSWHQGYFVLEQGVLHQYSDKNCSGTPVRSISLAPGRCHGCRRCAATDRKHAFEILLPHGSSFELAASSEAELQDWLVRLCQASCEQSNPRASVFGCIACCSVVTQSHVFMCHEDLQTNFLRSLASASLSSLTQIETDANAPTYCVLVFKRPVKMSHEEDQWCIYFNSAAEQEKFISAILDACTKSKQCALAMVPVEAKMSKRFQAGISRLNAFLTVGVA